MAVRIDNDADEFTRTTNLPSVGLYTIMGWFRIVTDRNTYSTFFHVRGSADQHDRQVQTDSDGTTLALWDGSGFTTSSALSVGVWNHICVTYDGNDADPDNIIIYLNGVQDISVAKNLTTDQFNTLYICNSSYGNEWLNGRVACVKIYDAVLTPSEIAQEMRQYLPVRTANLNSWYPMFSIADDEIDYSGNGRTLTVGGTLATEDGPPIPWKLGRRKLFLPLSVVVPPAAALYTNWNTIFKPPMFNSKLARKSKKLITGLT